MATPADSLSGSSPGDPLFASAAPGSGRRRFSLAQLLLAVGLTVLLTAAVVPRLARASDPLPPWRPWRLRAGHLRAPRCLPEDLLALDTMRTALALKEAGPRVVLLVYDERARSNDAAARMARELRRHGAVLDAAAARLFGMPARGNEVFLASAAGAPHPALPMVVVVADGRVAVLYPQDMYHSSWLDALPKPL